MKWNKQTMPESASVQDGTSGKKEQIGKPMLLPIIFCLVSGVLLILLGNLTMRITGYVLAAALFFHGAWMIYRYFRSEPMARIIEAKLAIGLVMLVTGSLLVFNPESLREQLPYVWGLALLYGGFLKTQYAFDRKSLGSQKWWIMLIFAAFSLVIGVISLLNPAFLGDRRELVIGIMLTLEAALDIGVFLLLKRKIQKMTISAAEKPETNQHSDAGIQNEPEKKATAEAPETEA